MESVAQREILKEGTIISPFFQRIFFFGRTRFEADCKTRKALEGCGGILPRENFENLHAVMAIFSVFQIFLGTFCLHFSTLILSASPNMMHFCSHMLDYANMRAEDGRLIANEEI